jgi:NAD(P)-dependent dehydrogenase (short-subunit alcohol dehydrogenase family)
MELEKKICIITGAAKGVGRATSLRFSREGAVVVLVDILEKELRELAERIHDSGQESVTMRADLSDSHDIRRAVERTMNQFGRIDVLVNNAGIVGPTKKSWEIQEEEWDRVFGVNLKSVYHFCRFVAPLMIARKDGKIINVASIAGKEGNENLAAYSASKAGVACFSRVLAKEVAALGIRVNSIAPALIETDLVKEMPKEQVEFLLNKIPLRRLGRPEEVAELILFLASDRSSFITGQCFNVTGGRGDY